MLSWAPSRGAALAIVLVSGNWQRAVRAWREDARRTASPNAGHPMAAAAGALGVRLEKVGQYVLNPTGAEPTHADLERAVQLLARAMLVSACLALVGQLARTVKL